MHTFITHFKLLSLLALHVVEQLPDTKKQCNLDVSDPPLEVLKEVEVM